MNSQDQAKAIIEAIQTEAERIWGDRWMAEITKKYCEIESQELNREIKPPQRRSQLGRIFEEGNATLPTLIRLGTAINGKIRIEVNRIEQLV